MTAMLQSPLQSGRAVASFVRLARHKAHGRWAAQLRRRSLVTAAAKPPQNLAIPSTARVNQVGVQQLSDNIYKQLFPNGSKPPPPELVELARDHLKRHDLLDKNTDKTEPIGFQVPPLQAPDTNSLDEHFYRLGIDAAEPFLTKAKEFAKTVLPRMPQKWKHQSGWTKYYCPDGGEGPMVVERVDAPDETLLAFDVEVLYKQNPFAIMACAAGPKAWYAWLSPWLLGETENEKQLVPLGDPTRDRIIVGHNIGYDRARILEEYDLKQTRNCYMDTMSLHVAVNGMCSRQRPTWLKYKKEREERAANASYKLPSDGPELLNVLENFGGANREGDQEDLWVARSSINSLRDVAKFHLDVTMDKTVRNDFGELDREGIVAKLDELLTYCAGDVAITQRVYSVVFPNYLQTCPHPVSFAALRHLSTVILPVNDSWNAYITNAEATYHKLSDAVQERLLLLTEEALKLKDDPEKWRNDPWLKQLDWSGQEIKMVKPKKKNDLPRPSKNQKMPGFPKWYKDLFPKKDAPINITVRTRVAPLLLRLQWDGHPLVWSDKYGWTFRVLEAEKAKYVAKSMIQAKMEDEKKQTELRDDMEGVYFKIPHKDGPTARCANPMAKGYVSYFENGILSSEFSYAKEALQMNASCSYWISARERIKSQMVVYADQLPGHKVSVDELPSHELFADELPGHEVFADEFSGHEVLADELPGHKVSVDELPCHELFADELHGHEVYAGQLPGHELFADELPGHDVSADQLSGHDVSVDELPGHDVSADEFPGHDVSVDELPGHELFADEIVEAKAPPMQGFILPQLIPMGTVTRRAVEKTWLTASNAKSTRVGSELKALVKAPPGYSFVGADVDSEELWIASLLGDAIFKLHGGNAIGFMTLEGTKAAGTDLHSRTASILGITRGMAKIFNYGRIYGAGLKFAAQLLRQFNPTLTDTQTIATATKLYAATKGSQQERKILYKRRFWRGGTESFVFNKLEEFAEQERPRTPVLGAGITEALMSRYVRKGGFLTSRINWAIQSSGVDYLHLLIIAMDYLTRRFNIHLRLAITVHDEIRYLVKNEDIYRAAMALQVANLWTRCMFAQQIGIDDLPQACAFFSAVDIDHVLRKEVDLDCVTPSHCDPIPPGESIDIAQLLARGDEARLDEAIVPAGPYAPRTDHIVYTPRVSVMDDLKAHDASTADLDFIRAQIVVDPLELNKICTEKQKRKRNTWHPYATAAWGGSGKGIARPIKEPMMVSEAIRAQRDRSSGYQRKIDWERSSSWNQEKQVYTRGS